MKVGFRLMEMRISG